MKQNAQNVVSIDANPRGSAVVQTIDLKKTYFGKIETPVLHGIDIEVRGG